VYLTTITQTTSFILSKTKQKKNFGAVAAGSIQTAQSAYDILLAGGNAFDAAIGAALTAFSSEPILTSPAGGGFLLAHNSTTHKNTLFDFFSQTPLKKKPVSDLDFRPVSLDFGDTKQTFHIGLGAVAIPSNLAGLFHIHKCLGTMPLKKIAQPAIKVAREGYKLSEFGAFCFRIVEPIIRSSEEAKAMYVRDNKLIGEGEHFAMPQWADTLEYLSQNGLDEFYKGEIAQKIVSACQEKGGHLTREDFEQYQVIERTPLLTNYKKHQVYSNPLPSAGGVLISLMLRMLAEKDFSSIDFGSLEHLTYLANTLRTGNVARNDRFKDLSTSDLTYLFDKKYLEKLRLELGKHPKKIGGTTHFTIVDKHKNIASMTSSAGEGAGFIVPNTGIMLNNMLGEADLNPKGFHLWKENTRLSSMMCPTLVFKNQKPILATGTGGANRIRTALLQVISNLIDFEMSSQQIIEAPRLHWDNNILDIELGFNDQISTEIKMPVDFETLIWKQKSMYFGGVHSVFMGDDTILGVADSRRSGISFY
jgi:gamma-glutamyltranspeptidase/glutathione hydrolase